jgi:hypothetical protein
LLFFIVFMVTLILLARRSTNEFVWATSINNVSGWTNPVASFSIGLLSPVFSLSGFDGVLHMSKTSTRLLQWLLLITTRRRSQGSSDICSPQYDIHRGHQQYFFLRIHHCSPILYWRLSDCTSLTNRLPNHRSSL